MILGTRYLIYPNTESQFARSLGPFDETICLPDL